MLGGRGGMPGTEGGEGIGHGSGVYCGEGAATPVANWPVANDRGGGRGGARFWW